MVNVNYDITFHYEIILVLIKLTPEPTGLLDLAGVVEQPVALTVARRLKLLEDEVEKLEEEQQLRRKLKPAELRDQQSHHRLSQLFWEANDLMTAFLVVAHSEEERIHKSWHIQ